MKKFIIAAVFGLFVCASYGQSFEKNDLILSGGLGRSILSSSNWGTYVNVPGYNINVQQPITIKAEYAMSDVIGLGVSSAYSSALGQWVAQSYNYELAFHKLSATARMNIHFLRKKVIDMYVGGGLGFKTGEYRAQTTNPNITPINLNVIPISLEASLGMRAYITPEVGAFAEFGAGHGYLQFGVVYKPLARTRNNE